MAKESLIVKTDKAPAAIGPYSQAVIAGGFVFCSGQIALDPKTGQVVGETAGQQTVRVMANLLGVLEGAGCSIKDVVKTTIFLKSMNDFQEVNTAYAAALGDHRPARATVEVARLPKDVLVEIDAVALVP
ncbi:MAG: RidA family protein [Planctomycetes bacterium]|nr:RidA family protein [Planctomycetota bacterium]